MKPNYVYRVSAYRGLSFLIFTLKFVFEMYLACCKLIVFRVQNTSYPTIVLLLENNKTTAAHLVIKTVQTCKI